MIQIVKNNYIKITQITIIIKREIQLYFSKYVYVSLGENCLADNILNRYNLKSFATIYSHGRSNIDYSIQLEKEKDINLLNKKYLIYDNVSTRKVVRNIHYVTKSNIFDEMHCNYFEFTHHDVINNTEHIDSMTRKTNRLKRYKGKKNYIFLYHYRFSKNISIESIVKKAEIFIKFYETNGKKCEFIIFLQRIVSVENERGMDEIIYPKRIRVFIFKTINQWAGNDPNHFWARNDDDLIAKMIQKIIH